MSVLVCPELLQYGAGHLLIILLSHVIQLTLIPLYSVLMAVHVIIVTSRHVIEIYYTTVFAQCHARVAISGGGRS